jgi:alkylhydroperoxidase family enzyme
MSSLRSGLALPLLISITMLADEPPVRPRPAAGAIGEKSRIADSGAPPGAAPAGAERAKGSTAPGSTKVESAAAGNSPRPKLDPALEAKARALIAERPGSEAAAMAEAILGGSQLGPGEGWFKTPPSKRHDWAWVLARHGMKPSGDAAKDRDLKIELASFKGPESLFDVLDRDGDGTLRADDFDWSPTSSFVRQAQMAAALFRPADRDGDGRLSREEWGGVFGRGGDKPLSQEGVRRLLIPKPPKRKPGSAPPPGMEGPTPEVLLKGLFAGEIGSMTEGPALNDPAPDFTLKSADGGTQVRLKDRLGKRPIVLVFGNFSCGPFRSWAETLAELGRTWGDRAEFLSIYVREAHPTDGWRMTQNDMAGIAFPQPTDMAGRCDVAGRCAKALQFPFPLLVDTMDDLAGKAYSGMPARLYVIDRGGRVAYKSARGPFGFRPQEMEQALALTLLEESPATEPAKVTGGEPPRRPPARPAATASGRPMPSLGSISARAAEPLPSEIETWRRLPAVAGPVDGRLPNWARRMAGRMPRTTAAMLELDHAWRTSAPIDPALRARARYVIATANRCEYGRQTALADFRRVSGLATLEEARRRIAFPEAEREDGEFVRLLSVAAPTLPDELFEKVRRRHGDRGVATLVLLAAYGNFQDRICLGLSLAVEDGGPCEPLAVRFVESALQREPILPKPSGPGFVEHSTGAFPDDITDPSGWRELSYETLAARLERSKSVSCRLPVPTWEQASARLPPAFRARPSRIVWNLVCFGYCPEMAVPWVTATRTMWAEAAQDRVFEESLFWVQTRAVECSYCMGHCEMLLKEAGLDEAGVQRRIRRLAGDDWSAFSPAEQRAFAYARKLSAEPWSLTPADYATLEADLGPDRAMAVFWWLCRGLYMTRISDGFRLPLERENVFSTHAAPTKAN